MFTIEDHAAIRLLNFHPARLRHAELARLLDELQAINPSRMNLEQVGHSYEGRPIYAATLGTGPTRVLAWSQMHGNEPTHTASLLDLINLLQRRPDWPVSNAILSGCTLTLVPMLNPDGAERYTRRNAQHIDVNRDALHLASPEGRILRQLAEEAQPHFAFNLHNQNARTSVDGRKPAAVSLIVPPIDEPDTQAAWTQQAKQVAAAFLKAVRPHCEGMISRYDADYMPRCFGEWFQQQGIATLTVEAGGWTTIDTTPLAPIHTVGLVNAMAAIADASYEQYDAAEYDRLPRSSEHYLFDVIVRGVEIVPGSGEPFRADIGINFTRQEDRVPVEGDGKIEDIGDLCVTSGKREIDAAGLKCLAGGIAYSPEITPLHLPTKEYTRKYLEAGITTVFGRLDTQKGEEVFAMRDLSSSLPIHVGFVGSVAPDFAPVQARARLIEALTYKGFGLRLEGPSDLSDVKWTERPLLSVTELPVIEELPASLIDRSRQTLRSVERMKITERGTVKLGAMADLVFFKEGAVQFAMLGGQVVFEKGGFKRSDCGEVLCRKGAVYE